MGAGQLRQGLAQVGREFEALLAGFGAAFGRPLFDAQTHRLIISRQQVTPESLRLAQILLLQPVNVGLEGPGRGQHGLVALIVRLIGHEDLAHDDGKRPAVHEDMMVAPDETVFLFAHADEMDAHEGRFGRVETLGPVGLEARAEAGVLLLGREVTPVLIGHGQLNLPQFHLHHPVQRLPRERGAQHRMSLHNELPGAAKRIHVQGAAQPGGKLFDIDA